MLRPSIPQAGRMIRKVQMAKTAMSMTTATPARQKPRIKPIGASLAPGLFVAWLAAVCLFAAPAAHAQETVCSRVKIEIKQELTLERQAFEAEMKINNTTDTGV